MIGSRFLLTLAAVGLLTGGAPAAARTASAQKSASADPVIVVETVKGTFEITTYPDDPKSLAHVLALVRRGFYRGLRFHWVTSGSIQFGDPTTRDMTKQDVWGMGGSGHPVGVAETSKRPFVRGTVGLAYPAGSMPDPRTADSQLFVIKISNPAINGKYAIIGHVTSGMNVVDKIEKADVIKLVYVKGEAPK